MQRYVGVSYETREEVRKNANTIDPEYHNELYAEVRGARYLG